MTGKAWVAGIQEPEKMDLNCPKCGALNEVLYFPGFTQSYAVTGSTGKGSRRIDRKPEKVDGACKDCGYKFKSKDLE
ncbi:MAG: hypothetical protein J4215_03180 [Candidatus Diapherotrites archaeon]|uniref:Uncharacterized protein n=1 Tax=Candidatus Iainarchaeum sp. TaxID=3101447 RepID=A0A8T4L7R4_9ARCH|nr:hypothetical protein [Candidatus Diapherotrites archaeon]